MGGQTSSVVRALVQSKILKLDHLAIGCDCVFDDRLDYILQALARSLTCISISSFCNMSAADELTSKDEEERANQWSVVKHAYERRTRACASRGVAGRSLERPDSARGLGGYEHRPHLQDCPQEAGIRRVPSMMNTLWRP